MAKNIYHESRSEEIDGQIAVAQVVINRQENTDKTLCQVIYAKSQFSWTLDEPSIHLNDPIEAEAFEKAVVVAIETMEGEHENLIGDAEYFVQASSGHPTWGKNLKLVGVVGNHAFYRKPKGN